MSGQVQAIFPPADFFSELRGEADHRIANSLALISSMVRIRARDAAHIDPVQLLNEVADRIGTVAKLHRLVAHSRNDSVVLSEFLHNICMQLSGGVATNETTFALDCACSREFPARIALPLGLITAELASNSLKYAHPAGTPMVIRIACREAPAGLLYVYEDDGVGFPENFDPTDKANMGMRFIHMLCQTLQAAPDWSSDDLGMRFEIFAPAEVL